ncbi:MAG: FkbM family methyltransferase [Thiobacillus sp.]|nr:FkbM family methyltransferase [Thiobacillus sp.]
MKPKSRVESMENIERIASQYEISLQFVTVKFAGHRIKFAIPNRKCLHFALSLERREPMTNKWILAFDRDDVFFDVGSNNGVFALMAAVVPGCRVYAFEPHFASYYTLVHNVYANDLQERVHAYPLAVSDKLGFDNLYLSAITAGKSLNNYGDARPSEEELWHAVIPQAAVSVSIDEFVRNTGVVPNHIKVDVDGIEPKIVAGARETLADARLKSIMIEIDEKDPQHMAIHDVMKDSGFNRFLKDEAGVFFFRD